MRKRLKEGEWDTRSGNKSNESFLKWWDKGRDNGSTKADKYQVVQLRILSNHQMITSQKYVLKKSQWN